MNDHPKDSPPHDKPCPCSCEGAPADASRRWFLTKVSVALGAVTGAIIGLPAVAWVVAPFMKRKEEIWRDVGPLSDFPPGTTKVVTVMDASPLPWAGVTAKSAAWVRREPGGKLVAFSVNCTHLGCPVRWEAKSDLFLCPCHGGVYYADGRVAAGPPPKPLPPYQVRENNGRVEVLTAPIPITTTTPVRPRRQPV